MTRSRLRSPTSKSMATTFLPRSAMPVATLAVVVVLPTPPLPEVMTTTLDTVGLLVSIRGTPEDAGKFLAEDFEEKVTRGLPGLPGLGLGLGLGPGEAGATAR